MSGAANKINNLSTRLRILEKKFEHENENTNNNDEKKNKDFSGNASINMLGFQNIQIAQSNNIKISDETYSFIIWKKIITQNGNAFGGISNENFIINTVGNNVFYEFIITVHWDESHDGFRTVALENPDGKIINSTFIPDNIHTDNDGKHNHQVVFKQGSQTKGNWKVRLYQNTGAPLAASVSMVALGPIVY